MLELEETINGSSFKDILEKFEEDKETDAVLMIGEIGGPQEVAAGKFAKENMKKPVIAYIAGLTAQRKSYGTCWSYSFGIWRKCCRKS